MNAQIPVRLLLLGVLVLLAAGCAETGGQGKSSDGFWGTLLPILTLIVGFFVGAMVLRDGGIRLSSHSHRHKHRRRTEAGWNRIRQRIQDGTKQGLAEWRGAGHTGEADWGDLSRRIEEHILEEMHKHHD